MTGLWRDQGNVTAQDWDRLVGWALERGHRIDTGGVRQFAGGIANLNYLIEFNGAPAVLRRPPAGVLAESANDMDREWRVLSRLNAVYPLAPRGLLYCADATVLGAPFQVLEYRPGVAIGGSLPDAMSADAPQRLTGALIDAMVSLHELDPDAVGLGELGRPVGFLERQLRGWTRRAVAVWPAGPPAVAWKLIEALHADVPQPSRVSLLHMDFKLNNMLIDPETLTVNAVIDWDMATRGCPLFDLGVLLSYWVEATDPEPLLDLGQMPTTTPGFASRSAVVDHYYMRARNCPERSLVWHVACARLRLAVAWMQLHRKWLAGDLLGEQYATFNTMADAVLAWAIDRYTRGEV